MSRSDSYRVADMLMAAEEITDITARGRSAFDTDVALRRAVERCLEIVGEAAKAVMLLFGVKPAGRVRGPADPLGECGSLPVASRALRVAGRWLAPPLTRPSARWLAVYRVGRTGWS